MTPYKTNEANILYSVRQNNISNNNRPFPSCLKPPYQSETWCTTVHMKMSLIYMWIKISFSYEKMGTKTCFEEEAKGNLEMAYFQIADTCTYCVPIFDIEETWRKNMTFFPFYTVTKHGFLSNQSTQRVLSVL